MDRRGFFKRLVTVALTAALASFPEESEAVRILDVKSPKRKTRPFRKSTRFIILHTTESDGPGTLECIARDGTAGYVVDRSGKIFRIMGRYQISVGCGRSMWKGLANLDNHAVNIEMIGYHNQYPLRRQMASLKYLVGVLRREFGVRARSVMPHAQVAYGRPNRWYRRSHRGRKRCGMIFATDPLRKKLGLSEKPGYDPDVRAKRLIAADDYLENILYGRMGRRAPDFVVQSRPLGRDPEDEDGPIRTIGKGDTVWEMAGDEFAGDTTIYLLPDGRIMRGDELSQQGFDFDRVQPGTSIAVGYVYGGRVTADRSPYSIAGKNWNNPETLYITDGKILTGDEISDEQIPAGTLLLFRR